ncbi:acyl-CoA thioesterase [Autumnicola musiva]|uniref:Acyl-CoA thioesterase n=1 Tax=Autumnicola musiva TaxID=3075589 RepID=A0ABU3D396_9FLAO|nr:acyl-CoA thioesterase [Zunongwangia sp. F117]MDT0676006.1 acyl-CoA thioesterase [Zunongwangia sp. F117]
MKNNPDVFEQRIIVLPEHLDDQQHVNNVQYVQWVQDIAKAHWFSRATPAQQENFFWVVVEHSIRYKQQAFLGEELILQTYVGKATHVTSLRYVNIKNAKTGKILVEAKTTWCLMSQETKKIAKISEELKQVFLE